MIYPNDLSVREARELYFKRSGFDASTYTDRWVKFPLGPFHAYLPNFKGRRQAVPFHDIDHVLTEYPTDWKGEFLISAYEIGTGCGKYWAGWMINFQGLVMAAILFPREAMRAFARGRRSKGVFGFDEYEPLLERKVGELRAQLTAPSETVAVTVSDSIIFYLAATASAVIQVGPLVALALLVLKR